MGQVRNKQDFGVVETSTDTFAGTGTTENLQNPPPNTTFWPCARGAYVTMDVGTGKPSEFQFTGGVADGPAHCDGKYKISGNQPGGVVLEANAGTNSNSDNAFTTIKAKDGDGKAVDLTITWSPYHPC